MRANLHVIAYVALVLAILAGVYRLETTTRENHTVLCAFKTDLERRAESAREFLESNPNGIPGVSREDIQRSLDSQQQTLLALSDLNC